ncbi:hypothetical protein [Blastococcus capsensis]|uniref:hypothetical protein n=1 Tax=Blastococcus capsensis TaxID=1564163 RepID=UPI00254225BC|nr:hypothetical protein [Blastococcus capsensis]MDK3256323.1 hypothetical protein [Blastococcus capsensis]
MVGTSQFRDPWLDEAFATYAEAVANPSSARGLEFAGGIHGDVGAAMDEFRTQQHAARVYGRGGATLLAAREAADAFDEALRCYVDASAWSIATPEDVGATLADLPAAADVLVRAGALDEHDLPDCPEAGRGPVPRLAPSVRGVRWTGSLFSPPGPAVAASG